MIPVDFNQQIIEGTFEHTLHHLIEDRLNTSIFDHRYKNEKTGAPTFCPQASAQDYSVCLFIGYYLTLQPMSWIS